MTESLKNKLWDDADIRKIDSEQLARYAFELNDSLKKQYVSVELFVAHWQGQRRLYRLDEGHVTDAGPSEQRLQEEWDASPALQAEFSGSFEAYAAFLKAESDGRVRMLRQG